MATNRRESHDDVAGSNALRLVADVDPDSEEGPAARSHLMLAPPPPQARTGSELIRATRPFEQESVARSWFELGSTLVVYSACLAGVVVAPWLWLSVGLAALAGVVQFRMFSLYHDHLHGSLLAESPLARVVMWSLGIHMLFCRSAWKETHNFHHKSNGKIEWASIGSYPVMSPVQLGQADAATRRKYLRTRHPLAIVFGYFFVGIKGFCIDAYRRNPKRHWGGPLALAIHVAGAVTLALTIGPWLAVLLWVLPVFVNHGVSSYLFYAQHNFPETRFYPRGEWDYTDAALHGSSFMEMNVVMRWLTANIGYHHVHHLNAKIPFYRLPEAMAAVAELQSPHRTSLRPSDIAACLSLKTWDPTTRRMVSDTDARSPA